MILVLQKRALGLIYFSKPRDHAIPFFIESNCLSLQSFFSAAEETVEPFLRKLRQMMEEKGLTAGQIYNADKTGLLWKCLPDRTLVSCHEKSAPGFKKSKDRLTVLGCTNATGTRKLKPVTGKGLNPGVISKVG